MKLTINKANQVEETDGVNQNITQIENNKHSKNSNELRTINDSNEKDNKVVITDFDNEGNKILSIRQIIYEYPDECDLSTFELEGKKVLQLIPKDNSFSFNSIKLFIDNDNLITKALVDDPATGAIQVDLLN